MKVIAFACVLVAVVLISVFTNWWRYVQTAYLILQTSPYEQSGTGAGTILILGDSTGYGTGVRDPKDSIAGRIGTAFPGYSLENLSVNGRTLVEAIPVAQSLQKSYDVVVVQLGANDLLQNRPLDAVIVDVAALKAAVAPHTRAIVMISFGNLGALPIFSEQDAVAYTTVSQEYHALLEAFADDHQNFTYVSLYEDPATDPFVLQPNEYLASDQLHPSAAGYGLWFTSLEPALRKALQSS